jgi:hypothetical protein
MIAGAPVELLRREAGLLVQRLRVWTPPRWGAGDRERVARHLAQVLADAAADLEGGPRRRLPDLGSPLALPDQLAVTADDVVRANPSDALATALTCHLLLHRHDLLGDEVPDTLAAQLGHPSRADLLSRAEQACTSHD